jgi:hypothetical protein
MTRRILDRVLIRDPRQDALGAAAITAEQGRSGLTPSMPSFVRAAAAPERSPGP